jgi:hypothetical protein
MTLKIEVAPGELIDKITILEIKLARIEDEEKVRNVQREYAVLTRVLMSFWLGNNNASVSTQEHQRDALADRGRYPRIGLSPGLRPRFHSAGPRRLTD